jgi:hypothetical protein
VFAVEVVAVVDIVERDGGLGEDVEISRVGFAQDA